MQVKEAMITLKNKINVSAIIAIINQKESTGKLNQKTWKTTRDK